MEKDSLTRRQATLWRDIFPWGTSFASRSNFEFGYLQAEGELVSKHLKVKNDILVIGSGNGREAGPICRDGHNIVCLDTAWIYLESGRRLFGREDITDVDFVQAKVREGLPFKEGSFDFVFFSLYSCLVLQRDFESMIEYHAGFPSKEENQNDASRRDGARDDSGTSGNRESF